MNLPIPDSLLCRILGYLSQAPDCVFLDTSKTGDGETQSLLFHNPVEVLSLRADQEAGDLFLAMEERLAHGYYLAGWFAYEFGYSLEEVFRPYRAALGPMVLARIGVYPPPCRFDHLALRPAEADCPPLPKPSSPAPTSYTISALRPSLDEADYQGHLARIKDYIAAGDTYQVNYTLKLLFDFAGSPQALYAALRRNQPVSYGAYLNLGGEDILSFSPELFFRKTGTQIEVRPMKGTCRRGPTPDSDRDLAAALRADPKNRSENVMIVDLLRNDLGRLCQMGQVQTSRLFEVETYATLHQMTSTIRGRLDDGIGLAKMFGALFPCGSVTGAPKIRTMEIIHELEPGRRGVYTGAIGFMAPDGDAAFNVPIRTIVLKDRQGEMGIGSGIVYDSDRKAEWQECLLKGRFLTDPQPDFQLIETILWQRDTGFWLLDEHLARLTASAAYFDYPLRPTALRHDLESRTGAWQAASLRVRVLLHRDGQVEISASPCPSPAQRDMPPATEPGAGLPTITVSRKVTDPGSAFLYHKTTLRDLYNAERELAIGQGHFEVVFQNLRGEITEGSISNILIRQAGEFYTPKLSSGLLAGVCRQYLLRRHPGRLHERVLTAADLRAAEAIYLANSVRGVVEVRLAEPDETRVRPGG